MKKQQYLPQRVTSELERIGAGIRTARTRRRMTQAELAERVGTTFHTVSKMERGAPGTSVGLYMKALWVLGLLEGLGRVADPAADEEGLILEAARAPKRVRAKQVSNDF
jgi:transcriptional regulator with XRE-family HTH domain